MIELIQVFDDIERRCWVMVIRNSTTNIRSNVASNVKDIIWISVFANTMRNIWRNARLDGLDNISTDKQLLDAWKLIDKIFHE